MGEWSKRIGEAGEEISSLLLEQIGWGTFQQGVDIPCVNASKHNARSSHGIDHIYVYRNPMINRQLMHAVVSVKASADPYPSNPATKFRGFMADLSDAAECYARSEQKYQANNRHSGISESAIAGVLLWFSLSPEHRDTTILPKTANCRVENSHSIFVVDNAQASFLYESIRYAEQRFDNKKAEFFYFNNGRNYEQSQRLSRGPTMPVEYLTAGIIPLVFETGGDSDRRVHFVLATSDPFSEMSLHRVMGLAKDMTQKLASSILIMFPDYDKLRHKNTVRAVQSSFSERDFTDLCTIDSFSSDFRKL